MTPPEFKEWAELLPEPCALARSDGRVVAVNEAASARGLRPGSLFAWAHPDDAPLLQDLLRRASRARTLLPGRVRTADGRTVAIRCGLIRREAGPAPAWLLLRLADEPASRFVELTRRVEALQKEVSRRKAVEAALAAERERLAVTLGSIGDAVMAVDTRARIVLVNPVAEQLTGWSAAEAVGRPIDEIFRIYNERTGAKAPDPVDRVLRTGVIVGLANHTVLESRGGERRSIADSAAPIRGADGATFGVVLVFRDVSQQQRIEDELARASKLESLGVLAGGIAHDFNNVLTAIVANLSLARAKLPTDHVARARVDAAVRACERAQGLTRQLLTFAKGGAPMKKATSIEAVLRESATFALQGSSTRATIDLEADLRAVDADPDQLGQVLHNLVLNAAEAMTEGGTILVRARNEVMGPAPTQPLVPGPFVRVDVEDGGPGIPAEHLPKLFDPFYTTKPTGTGLGLATVYSIVHRHGGHVEAANRPGGGARFSVWFPAADGPEEATRAGGPDVALLPRGGRVLVMDDDPVIRELAGQGLADLGFEGAFAADGAEAVALAEVAVGEGRPYVAVILDLTVPGGMGGREALERIRKVDPEVRAVVSSGYSNDPVLADPRSHGFHGVLPKPWKVEELAAVLAAVLGMSRAP
ncbi:MAG: hybrid sensor histidine kinase/response regulator [Myxococcota bacterium]